MYTKHTEYDEYEVMNIINLILNYTRYNDSGKCNAVTTLRIIQNENEA